MTGIELLNSVLLGELDLEQAALQIREIIGEEKFKSKDLPIQRTIDCLKDGAYADFCGNLRQCF